MPQGDKSSYTSKQRRQARHIEDSERKAGRSSKRAAQIAYATVNKQDGGGLKKRSKSKKSGSTKSASGRKKSSRSHAAMAGRRSSRRTGESRAHA